MGNNVFTKVHLDKSKCTFVDEVTRGLEIMNASCYKYHAYLEKTL